MTTVGISVPERCLGLIAPKIKEVIPARIIGQGKNEFHPLL